MRAFALIVFEACLVQFAISGKTGKPITFPGQVEKIPEPQPAEDEPPSIEIEVPSNAENLRRHGDIQKINYEPDKGHLALEYNKHLRDDYYWPVPMGYGYAYAYAPPSLYGNMYNGLPASNNVYNNYGTNLIPNNPYNYGVPLSGIQDGYYNAYPNNYVYANNLPSNPYLVNGNNLYNNYNNYGYPNLYMNGNGYPNSVISGYGYPYGPYNNLYANGNGQNVPLN